MEILYGVEGKYFNVTHTCSTKLVHDNVLKIPASEKDRCGVFGDPLFGTLKHIRIGDDIYTHEEEIIIVNPSLSPLKTQIKNISHPEEKLREIHSKIQLDFGSMRDEYPEQLMAVKYVQETDTVLEIGGNIGRNSCVIASLLNDDKRLVVLECGEIYAIQLEHNRAKNAMNFYIENSAMSKVPLIQKEWNTFVSEIVPEGYTKVKTITFDEIVEKYGLTFNILVADCEGAMYQILKDEPNLLKNIDTIIIENDFIDPVKKDFVHQTFLKNGFQLVYNQAGGWGICYTCFFQVYKK